MKVQHWIASLLLVSTVAAGGVALAAWKKSSLDEAAAAAASQPEPMESVVLATAEEFEHRQTTTSIGTVRALRSITLRNELAGTVAHSALKSGQIVELGTVLVAQDISVEQAELKAQEAQAALAEATLVRMQRLSRDRAVPEMDLDRAKAERDIALAQTSRTRAMMARKTIKAPFRARVGLADLHPGQYLEEGTELTTLQGVDDGVHVDFTVTQMVAAALREGNDVEILISSDDKPVTAKIVAIDSRVDYKTRNASVRAKITDPANAPSPGASVRVRVPVGTPRMTVAIPVSALRRGPEGDHVFVIEPTQDGKTRAHQRLVQSSAVHGDQVLIDKGLVPGEKIAASGSFKLREAVLVAVAPEPPATTSAQAQ
ncbi:MAG: efflux RND transporter periplasmic adaptor subunit [Verrucomicrobium sp.]|nr:efflux RND transporter periplasmic adaptor subunit [Verrucomicrobium sp.]